MKKLLLLLALAGLAYWHFGKPRPATTLADGTRVLTVEAGGARAVLAVGERFEEGYVLFGANGGVVFGDALLSGLPRGAARKLYARYPDLGRCNSAGSAELQGRVESFNAVAADRGVKTRLTEAMGEVRRRAGSAESRVCIRMTGSVLGIKTLEQGGAPMQFDDSVLSGHYLVEKLETVDCGEVTG